MDKDIKFTIRNFIKTLSSSDDLSRVKARKALVAVGASAVASLVDALKDTNHLVRWEAVKALGEIGDPNAAPALVRALEDEEFDVRWLAAEGLIEMNVKALKPLFQALIEDADSVFLRRGAHHVLHDLAKGELREYLAPVLMALEDIDPVVQVPIAASHAMELVEKFQETAQKTNDPLLRQFAAEIPSKMLDISPHRRVQRYARSLSKPILDDQRSAKRSSKRGKGRKEEKDDPD